MDVVRFQITRFALVGCVSTFIYVAAAIGLEHLFGAHFGQSFLSLLAYGPAAVFSYSAHRIFTFESDSAYSLEIPRFVVLTAVGATLSFGLPFVTGTWMNLPMFVTATVVTIAIPIMNYIVLDRWVFGERSAVSG
ncbi:GtrA family protein [Nitratireductor sp. XY-223]|uniref:GtrA family protein n=1 Tax=Nitratireductor sp. XY-223 TaxID=2561926 RepID=UPI00145BD420|nr:GtrA family protein [Nitratireductor sp. XY-223]